MNIDHISALICRGVGLLLLILGFIAVLTPLFYRVLYGSVAGLSTGRVHHGWLQSFLFFVGTSLPAITQIVVGALLLVFSRPFGRLLASGLSSPVA